MQIKWIVTSKCGRKWCKITKYGISVQIMSLQGWCENYTFTRYQTSAFLELKLPYLLLQSLTEFLVLVLCNVHIRSHAVNEKQEQITLLEGGKLLFPLWMERAWSPLCCHGNVKVDVSWNFVMSVTTVLSFSSIQKKSWERFNFSWFDTPLCLHIVSTSWRHKPCNLHEPKSWISRQPRVLSQ